MSSTYRPSLALLVTLLTLTAAADSLKIHPRHDGKSHKAAHDAREDTVTRIELVKRQGNGAADGISAIDDLVSAIASTSPPSTISANHPSSTTYSISSSPVSNPSSVPSSITSYAFPSIVIQVPVATICPDDSNTLSLFSVNVTDYPTPTLVPSINPGGPIINATVILPNNTTSTFLTTSSSALATSAPASPSTPSDAARIIQGSDGCQTIYAPTTTTICSTVVQLVGIPAATVSDCDQYITFSSEAAANTDACLGAAGIALAEVTSVGLGAMSVTTVPNMPSPATEATSNAAVAGVTEAPQYMYDAAIMSPGTYYAAPWHDVAKGGVPSLVRAEICSALSSDTASVGCVTAIESWSVSTVMVPGTSVATRSFEGVSLSCSLL